MFGFDPALSQTALRLYLVSLFVVEIFGAFVEVFGNDYVSCLVVIQKIPHHSDVDESNSRPICCISIGSPRPSRGRSEGILGGDWCGNVILVNV